MALSLAPVIFKLLVLKVFKGAIIGLVRFFHRIFRIPQMNNQGETLCGFAHVNQVINKEWHKKQNIVYLIIMLSSAIYGLQELCIWLWTSFAKWRYREFCTFTPAALELPDSFIQRILPLSWLATTLEITKWVFMASLFYWPKTENQLRIIATENPVWINVIRNRWSYLIRIDMDRQFNYQDMSIKIDAKGSIEINTLDGYKANI